MIVEFIDAYRDRFGVDPICAALFEHGASIAASTYYGAKARGPVAVADLADAYDANTLRELWVTNRRVYGVLKRPGAPRTLADPR